MQVSEIKLSYRPKVKLSEQRKITSSRDVFAEIFPLYDQDTIAHIESFLVLFLNKANRPIGWKTISIGGTAGTVADVKVIFQCALLMNASAIIITHNHPSGSLQPSQADIELTKKIKQAGLILDIPLLDHLIVSWEERYYSFADEGMI